MHCTVYYEGRLLRPGVLILLAASCCCCARRLRPLIGCTYRRLERPSVLLQKIHVQAALLVARGVGDRRREHVEDPAQPWWSLGVPVIPVCLFVCLYFYFYCCGNERAYVCIRSSSFQNECVMIKEKNRTCRISFVPLHWVREREGVVVVEKAGGGGYHRAEGKVQKILGLCSNMIC